MTIYLIDGKPHRLCDCDEHSELCQRGGKRALQTCGFSRCFVPAPDAIYTMPERNYSPEELYDVLEHTCLPTDVTKRQALLELIKALEQPDAGKQVLNTAAERVTGSLPQVEGEAQNGTPAPTAAPVAHSKSQYKRLVTQGAIESAAAQDKVTPDSSHDTRISRKSHLAENPASAAPDIKRDAERYRWLRSGPGHLGDVTEDIETGSESYSYRIRVGSHSRGGWAFEFPIGDDLDAAIDAAIEKEGMR